MKIVMLTRTCGFIALVLAFGLLLSCNEPWDGLARFTNVIPAGLKQASGCAGCQEMSTGALRIVNDTSTTVVHLTIVPSDAADWDANRLPEPLPPEYYYEEEVDSGSWDVGIVTAADEAGVKFDVWVDEGAVVDVLVSEMLATLSDNDDGGPFPEEGEPVSGEGEADHGDVTDSSGSRALEGGETLDIVMEDGATLTIPAVPYDGVVTTLALDRIEQTLNLDNLEMTSAGVVRELTFEPIDLAAKNLNAADIVPTLTIPASEIAGWDPDTIAVMRIGDLYLPDEEAQPDRAHFLPVFFTESGDLQVADFYMADSIISDIVLRDAPPEKQQTLHARRIRYVAGTFEGSYNWNQNPVLQRFYSREGDPAGRVTRDALNSDTRAQEDAKTVRNIMLLVHGHNEEEKMGYEADTAEAPWRYGYKRDVWTPFYQYVRDYQPEALSCTAFYEYIYPTYRPIFTPNSGPRLDQDFAQYVNALVREHNNALDDNQAVNLYIVAHSMGGLVARAGIQLFNSESHSAFEKLVTWGTPHLGTPLVTLRQALSAPNGIYSLRRGLVSFPLDNIDNTLYAFRRAVEGMQRDAPGTRELRWANSHTTTPHNLRLGDYFSFDVDAALEPSLWNQYDLYTGNELYNANLHSLNASDTYWLSPKYHAIYGITPKRMRVTYRLWVWPRIEGTYIERGASVIPWLIQNADDAYEGATRGSNDGAVPYASMIGAGIIAAMERFSLGDTDHEEYFGAPAPHGVFHAESKAERTAAQTMLSLALDPCDVDLQIGLPADVDDPYIVTAHYIPEGIDQVTFRWDWGDGQEHSTGQAQVQVSEQGHARIEIRHTYGPVAEDTEYTLTVTLRSETSTLGSATRRIAVTASTINVTVSGQFDYNYNGGEPPPYPCPTGPFRMLFNGCIEPATLASSYRFEWRLYPVNFKADGLLHSRTVEISNNCDAWDEMFAADQWMNVNLVVYDSAGNKLGEDTVTTCVDVCIYGGMYGHAQWQGCIPDF